MKAILAIAVLCLAFNVNALIFPTIERQTNSGSSNNAQFTEYAAVYRIISGFLAQFGVDKPVDSIYCHNQDSAIAVYNYIHGAALVASSTNRATVAAATGEFLATVGNRLYEKLSEATTNCIVNSKDFAKVKAVLGEDPTAQHFVDAYVNLIANDTGLYQTTQNLIYEALNAGQYESAGRLLGGLQKNVAAAIKRASSSN